MNTLEKLGYKKVCENDTLLCYRKRQGSHIFFYKDHKQIDVAGRELKNKIITFEQLQAINEITKELGWYE